MAFTAEKKRRVEAKRGSYEEERKGSNIPWVTWIAIALGVAMTGIGTIMLLWGFMWQTDVGELGSLQEDDPKGGPCLIPVSVAMMTIGILWVITGWRGFKKARGSDVGLMMCPNCSKMIESDLNFCYLCNTTFENKEAEEEDVEKEGGEGQEKARKAKPFSPGRDQ
ncbi:MAG: hypothetical protein JXA22_06080 [Candidatus Thermoplasmatota archaeon]|nr:hypothetical protein [Candidatus Thermoplasmatota archaeon]